MDRTELLELVTALGRRFQALGAVRHLELARHYYAEVRAGRSEAPHHTVRMRSGGAWSAEFVVEWMARLRLAPYERKYEVRLRNALCPTCKRIDGIRVAASFPGGSKQECSDGTQWLVLDGVDPR